MQIAMVAAGFSAGEADQVRRSMAAWQRRGGLQQLRDRLIAGCSHGATPPNSPSRSISRSSASAATAFRSPMPPSFALLAYASALAALPSPRGVRGGSAQQLAHGLLRPGATRERCAAPRRRRSGRWTCRSATGIAVSKPGLRAAPEVRLGLRMVSGLSAAQGVAIEAQRRTSGVFIDVDELAHRAGISRRSLALLAQAGALESLAGHRRQAHWQGLGAERLPGLLAGRSAREPVLAFPAPPKVRRSSPTTQSLGLTLGRHPLALLRGHLDRLHVHRATDLAHLAKDRRIRIAGIVTHRQRPETAAGVMFMSLEDETGISNVIVWPSVQVTQRHAVFRVPSHDRARQAAA